MTNKSLHILIIPSWFPDKNSDFEIAPFIQEQIVGLTNLGHKVNVLHPNLIEYNKKTIFKKNNLDIYFVNTCRVFQINSFKRFPRFNTLEKIILIRRTYKVFKNYLKIEGKPDVIHSHSVFLGGIIGNYLIKKFHLPHVVTEHSSHFIIQYQSLTKNDIKKIRRVLNNATKVIFVSNFQKESMNELFQLESKNQIIIHNLVSDIFFTKENKETSKDLTFVCLGYINNAKNHELLIKAFLEFHKIFPNVKLKIIGDGALRDKIENLIKQFSIENSVQITGFLDRSQVLEELRTSNILVSSSRIETFGINIIEALAMGLPVVCTNSGGPNDIINDFNGIIVKNNNIQALTDGMIKMVNNYNKYNSTWIKDDCKRRFSQEEISMQVEELYKSITKKIK